MKRISLLTSSLLLLAGLASAEELAIGSSAPSFTLVDARNSEIVTFQPGDSPAVVIFTCNSCPYAKAFESRIIELGREYQSEGVRFYAVNPNDDVEYPAETFAEMKKRATERNYPFPYLKDATSDIARAWGARVTPHAFVIDSDGRVVYHGYVDDSAKKKERQHEGLKMALDSMLAGQKVADQATKAFGCTIKWKG